MGCQHQPEPPIVTNMPRPSRYKILNETPYLLALEIQSRHLLFHGHPPGIFMPFSGLPLTSLRHFPPPSPTSDISFELFLVASYVPIKRGEALREVGGGGTFGRVLPQHWSVRLQEVLLGKMRPVTQMDRHRSQGREHLVSSFSNLSPAPPPGGS